jgi:pyruvate formate lyase activating enzyme
MKIAGLVKSSTVDFPGLLAAVVFSPGCNLDCFYCHNRNLLSGVTPLLDNADVLDFLKRRCHLLDGVVFSGGEPTLQVGLADMISQIHELGYKIKLDTNGTRPQILRQLLAVRLLDYVAIDCKAPWARYPEICDCNPDDVAAIRQSLQILSEAGLDWEIRTTVIPQLSPADLTEMARTLPLAPRFILQRFIRPSLHRAEDRFRLDATGYTPARMVLIAEELRQFQPNIRVR